MFFGPRFSRHSASGLIAMYEQASLCDNLIRNFFIHCRENIAFYYSSTTTNLTTLFRFRITWTAPSLAGFEI